MKKERYYPTSYGIYRKTFPDDSEGLKHSSEK
jgi:hypothetical protein